MQKKLVFLTILIISNFIVCTKVLAQAIPDLPPVPHHGIPRMHDDVMNMNGMHLHKHDGFFEILGLKISEEEKDLAVSIYFNDAVDTKSISSEAILIDDVFLPRQTVFLFNRSRRMLRFNITKKSNFSIKMISVKAFDGRPLLPFEEKNLNAGDFFKYQSKNVQQENFPPVTPPFNQHENHNKEKHRDEI